MVREQWIYDITCCFLDPNSQNASFKASENIRSHCTTRVDHYLKLQNDRVVHFPSVLSSKRKFQVGLLTKIVIARLKCWNRELLPNLLFA